MRSASTCASSARPRRSTWWGATSTSARARLDSWNEEGLKGQLFHTDEERARFARLLAAGLVDVFRARHPELRAFSWWDYRAGDFHRGHGLRIDGLLASEPLAARVREVEIDRDWRKKKEGLLPSDHAPVWAEIGDGPAAQQRPS